MRDMLLADAAPNFRCCRRGVFGMHHTIIAAIALCALAPPAVATGSDPDLEIAGIVANAIVSTAKDPFSVRFMTIGTPDGTNFCVVYSATNSFNARITGRLYYNATWSKA